MPIQRQVPFESMRNQFRLQLLYAAFAALETPEVTRVLAEVQEATGRIPMVFAWTHTGRQEQNSKAKFTPTEFMRLREELVGAMLASGILSRDLYDSLKETCRQFEYGIEVIFDARLRRRVPTPQATEPEPITPADQRFLRSMRISSDVP